MDRKNMKCRDCCVMLMLFCLDYCLDPVDSSKGQKIVFTGGLPASQTPWRGAGSPSCPPAYREAPPLGLSVFSWYQDYWTCPNTCDKDFRILTCPNPCVKDFRILTCPNPCVKDFRILDLLEPLRQRFPDFQTSPAPEEFSDPNLTPLPTHPGIKYVARALAAIIL